MIAISDDTVTKLELYIQLDLSSSGSETFVTLEQDSVLLFSSFSKTIQLGYFGKALS